MYIRFNNSNEPIKADVIRDGHVVTLKFYDDIVVNMSGFTCFLDEKCEYDISGDSYFNFTTIYRYDTETKAYNGYQLSDDGSIWVKPKDPTKTVEVKAIWNDNNDALGIRPKKVNVTTYANGDLKNILALSDENNWTKVYEEVPLTDVYTIEPKEVEGYTFQIVDTDVIYTLKEEQAYE